MRENFLNQSSNHHHCHCYWPTAITTTTISPTATTIITTSVSPITINTSPLLPSPPPWLLLWPCLHEILKIFHVSQMTQFFPNYFQSHNQILENKPFSKNCFPQKNVFYWNKQDCKMHRKRIELFLKKYLIAKRS